MRLVIVSNRLPVTVVEENHVLQFKESVGGLATGLSSYVNSLKKNPSGNSNYLWVGWPGINLPEKKQQELVSKLEKDFSCYPVFLPGQVIEKFYHGLCNKTIWPLFHYFPSLTSYDEELWNNYKQVNEIFCEVLSKILLPGDVLWIHDYHFMLLPGMIRQRFPDVPIGFFLHIPFPSFELFRILPSEWRKEILKGLLGANLVGFHTYDYTLHFLRCVQRILGLENDLGQMVFKGRIIKAETFPMGISFEKFQDSSCRPEVREEMETLKGAFEGKKTILSVDRLDYTKGIAKRLQGYEEFLNRYPSWRGRVTLILVVVPSRIKVEHYQLMKRQIDEKVGEINGKFGNINWTPILYSYRYLPESQLLALYNICDVALITPLRDGMNLVAKEFVSCKSNKKGVLILSEMAGASKETVEAIIINPNYVKEIASALEEALEMPEEEQIRRNEKMQIRLSRYDVDRWAEDFIQSIQSVVDDQRSKEIKLLGREQRKTLVDAYKSASKRLIFSDYDGTLVPFAEHPNLAKPDKRLYDLLEKLTKDAKNDFVLISGRSKNTLQEWFGDYKVGMVAEHGVWIKKKEGEWKNPKNLKKSWMDKIQPILEVYADRIPGSFVEIKEFSLVWHFRMADPEIASLKAKELVDVLVNFTANIDVQILPGNKIIEVRNAGINKGDASQHWLTKGGYDFIMAMGDDLTDEDLFKSMPESAYSLKVGSDKSLARFIIKDSNDALDLLEEMLA
jgi:trehalose 6-phosphate synthase/phosphatase